MKFEKGFLLGAATAAHQVEGNNTHNDCWAQEQMKYTSYAEPSLDAVDHYHRYEEDIRLLKEAGLNAYRFSLEWARIESEEGVFDEKEIEHYRDVILCCKKYGVEPVVTLFHFSSPVWLIRKGGWEADSTPDDFAAYVRVVAEKLGPELGLVCTINEANMGLQIAAIAQRYRQQMKAAAARLKAGGADNQVQMGINFKTMMENQKRIAEENKEVFGTENPAVFCSARSAESDAIVMKAHEKARAVLRKLCPQVRLGLTLSLHDVQAADGCEKQAEQVWNSEFSHYVPYIKDDDFLGVQCYSRNIIGENGPLPVPEGAAVTQMGYENYPESLEHVIRRVHAEFGGDIIVTENGIATADDAERVKYLGTAIAGVQSCIRDGIPVKGYFCWSLLDNFEWQKGFAMTFGLIAVDRSTQKRFPKPSLAFLGSYAPD